MVLRHKILALGAVLLLTGLGCKSLPADQATAIRPVTLNYWTVFDNVDELKKRAAEYQALYPHVTVKIKQVRYNEFDNALINALADDVQPDIVSIHTRWLRQYQTRLATMPAQTKMGKLVQTNNITKDTQVLFDTYPSPTVDTIKRDYLATVADDAVIGGKIYGLPLSIDNLAVYLNKDLLDKAGIAEAPKTWDEFVAAVKLITKLDKDGQIVQSGVALGTGKNIDNSFDIISAIIAQNGVTLATAENAVGFASGLDRPSPTHPTLQALNFYTDFARPTKDVYSWNAAEGNAFDAFTRGKTGFYLGFAYDYNRIKSRAPELNVEVVPLFQLNKNAQANSANYWLESVLKKSKNQNEAWDFIRFLSTPDNLKKYSDATKIPSPVRAHLKAEQADPILSPFASQLLVSKNWYRGNNISAVEEAFNTMVETLVAPKDIKVTPVESLKRDAAAVAKAATVAAQTMR